MTSHPKLPTPPEPSPPLVYDGMSWNEPDPFAGLWVEEVDPTHAEAASWPPVDLQGNWLSRKVQSGVDWVADAFDAVEQRRPGWGRKAMALGMLAVAHLGVLGGAVYEGTGALRHDAPQGAEHHNHIPPEIVDSQQEELMPATSEEQRLYDQADVVVQNHPFEVTSFAIDQRAALAAARSLEAKLTAELTDVRYSRDYIWELPEAVRKYDDIRSRIDATIAETAQLEQQNSGLENIERDEAVVKSQLEHYQAEFNMAVRTSQGIMFNIYTSKLDDKTEPLEIDPRALDVLITKVLDIGATLEGNPITSDIAVMRQKAMRGQLNLRLSLVLVSDERLCLVDSETPGVDKVLVRPPERQQCSAIGINVRAAEPHEPTNNQFLVVLDSGTSRTTTGDPLPPDLGIALTVAHEVAHGLAGASSKNGTEELSSDQVIDGKQVKGTEHSHFVEPVQAKLQAYLQGLIEADQSTAESQAGKHRIAYLKPVHVDHTETSDTG